MTLEFSHRTEQILIVTVPEDGGFNANIFRLDRETRRSVTGESDDPWRRLDLPRPTKSLARQDAQELAITELYQEDTATEAGSEDQSSRPQVTAEQIIERAHTAGLTRIGDSLRQHLGDVPQPYAIGFERAIIVGLPPPREITLPLYLAGYEDGQIAFPILLDAGAVIATIHDHHHWRDLPNLPRNEGIVLSGSDQFADYIIEQMALDIQPVFEPGYPSAEGEIRELRVTHYLQATATLHERPLPKDWFYAFRPFSGAHPEYEIDLRGIVAHERITHLGFTDGRAFLTFTYNRPGDEDRPECSDPAWVLNEAKRMARQVDVYLQRRRNDGPEAFVQDPATTDLQRQAAPLRRHKESGPQQIPEISDERAAELGEAGLSNQQTVRRWNEQSRESFAESMTKLDELENQLRERGADPFGRGDLDELEKASGENQTWYQPHDGHPAAGWEPYTAPGITDEQLLQEITVVVEATAPGEFVAEIVGPGLIEITFRNPPLLPAPEPPRNRPHIPGYGPDNPLSGIIRRLERPLAMAARRWWVKPWAMPPARDLGRPDHWAYPQRVRWQSRIKRGPRLGSDEPVDANDPRLTHMEVQLAPSGSRVPVEWEC